MFKKKTENPDHYKVTIRIDTTPEDIFGNPERTSYYYTVFTPDGDGIEIDHVRNPVETSDPYNTSRRVLTKAWPDTAITGGAQSKESAYEQAAEIIEWHLREGFYERPERDMKKESYTVSPVNPRLRHPTVEER